MTAEHHVGLVLGSAIAPEDIPAAAATAEQCGFDEIWLAEDFFFTGGISGASLVLGATSHVKVGLGVVSAVARHPALLAMELSTLSRNHQDRLIAGVGLGVPAWVRQMGLHPKSPLAAVRECVTSVKSLLRGDTIDRRGDVFDFNDVRLTYPETGSPTPVWMGVSGPNMLQLSGEIADGTVLSACSSHTYVRWAKERIEEGRERGGRTDSHPVTVFALYAVDDDGDAARASARATLAFYRQYGSNALTDVYGVSDELNALVAEGGYDAVLAGMPDQWVDDLTISGTPAECAAKIQGFYDAGADSVALFPIATDRLDEIVRLTADRVLSAL
jgi:5,10-methylenetetrahydromethanopterin reductase